MKRKHLERAAMLALDLAAEITGGLPECCAVPAEDLVPLAWPLALRLTRLEVRAAKDRKHAMRWRKRIRRARREVEAMLASQDGTAASVTALLRSVPFSAGHWRVGLVPGAPVPEPSRQEREAA